MSAANPKKLFSISYVREMLHMYIEHPVQVLLDHPVECIRTFVSDLTWLMAGTVDPSHQGSPRKEQTATITDTTSRSRW